MTPYQAQDRNPKPTTAPSDADLVGAARAGETGAWDSLLRRHWPMLRRMAYRYGGGVVDAEDLVQDVAVEALRSLGDLEDPRCLPSWLVGIMRRKALFGYRRARIRSRLLQTESGRLPGASPSALGSPEASLELRRITRVLADMPGRVGEALYLRRIEGLKLGEVAEELHTSLATTKRWLEKGEAHLGTAA